MSNLLFSMKMGEKKFTESRIVFQNLICYVEFGKDFGTNEARLMFWFTRIFIVATLINIFIYLFIFAVNFNLWNSKTFNKQTFGASTKFICVFFIYVFFQAKSTELYLANFCMEK